MAPLAVVHGRCREGSSDSTRGEYGRCWIKQDASPRSRSLAGSAPRGEDKTLSCIYVHAPCGGDKDHTSCALELGFLCVAMWNTRRVNPCPDERRWAYIECARPLSLARYQGLLTMLLTTSTTRCNGCLECTMCTSHNDCVA